VSTAGYLSFGGGFEFTQEEVTALDDSFQAYVSYEALHTILDPKDQVRYLDVCVECRFRPNDVKHEHLVMAGILRGQEHRAWFDPNAVGMIGSPIALPDEISPDPNTIAFPPSCGGLYSSWHQETWSDGRTFMNLTIDRKTYVWKLTDEIDPVTGRVLGLWPD